MAAQNGVQLQHVTETIWALETHQALDQDVIYCCCTSTMGAQVNLHARVDAAYNA